MNRFAALLLTAVLVVASVSALPAAASAATTTISAPSAALQADANATNVSPGQRLAGTIGAGQAEFEGEVALRTYGVQYAIADSNASKAAVIEQRLEDVRERLQALDQRKAALEEARENGSMSEGEYRARVTTLAGQSRQLEQLVNASEVRARGLPDDVLAERGINVTAIRTLQAQAADLTGQEVAEIARSVAGPEVGRSVSDGPSTGIGRPDAPDDGEAPNATAVDAREAISDAQSQVATAQQRLERANARAGAAPNASVAAAIDDAEAELERAQAAIDRAQAAIDRAQAAIDDGDVEAALEHARDAIDHAERAEAHADGAIDAAGESGQPTETGEN